MSADSNLPRSSLKITQSATDWMVDGGEIGELIRSMDWSATPLGPRDAWPQTLREVVNLVLSSSYPMAVLWGSELLFIYNDAHKAIIADRHPRALGLATREVWPEVWELNQPIFERVMSSGETVHLKDQLFRIANQDSIADIYFTISYSPIRAEDGGIRGTLVVFLETTKHVLLKQRPQMETKNLERQIASQKQAGEEVWASERQLRSYFENAGDAIYILEAETGRIRDCNERASLDLGYSREEILKLSAPDIESRLTSDEIDAIHHDLSAGVVKTIDGVHKRKDGTLFPIEIRLSSLFSTHSHLIIAVVRDVTVRKQNEQILQKSEAKLRDILDATPFPVALVDTLGDNIEFWSRSALDLFGHTAPTAKEWYQLAYPDPDYRHEVMERWKPALEKARRCNQTVNTGEYRVTCRDGSVRICELYAAFLAEKLVVTFNDITECRRAEEALRESEDRFGTLFEEANDGMLLADAETKRFTLVNRQIQKMLDYSEVELQQMTVADIHPAAELSAVLDQFEKLARGKIALSPGIPMRRKDGTVFYADVYSTAVHLKHRKCMLGVFRDITERKRADEEKAQLEAQLRQANKMESVGRLAGGVAHEFNNMLGVILGHAELALSQVDPAQPLHDDLNEIRKAAERSANLTRQLLAFARKQTAAPRVLDLNLVITNMLNMLQKLIGEDINLNWQPIEKLWSAKIDPSQIDQMLTNLCVNARDAISGVGNITIGTGNSTLDENYCAAHIGSVPGEYVTLTMSDDGCGMDKDTLANIFEPFFTTKEFGKSTGLGLATIYGIVKQNNGYIDVCSEPGQGATFTIYLPRYVDKTEHAAGTECVVSRIKRGHETILLVEDELAILKMATRMLEIQGYTVLTASTPGEAIRLAKEHSGEIYLLITDVVMPEMNGQDLAKNLLSLYPHIKCLFMSGYTSDIISDNDVFDEGVSFIQKPFTSQSLATKIREMLGQA